MGNHPTHINTAFSADPLDLVLLGKQDVFLLGWPVEINKQNDEMTDEINKLKDEIKNEINKLKDEMTNEINNLNTEMTNEINNLNMEMTDEINDYKKYMFTCSTDTCNFTDFKVDKSME